MRDHHDLEHLLRHQQWLRSLAFELVGDGGAADDLMQQTWLAAIEKPPLVLRRARQEGEERPLRSWLAKVMRNAASRRYREEQHRRAREERAARPEPQPSVLDSLEVAALSERLARAVMELEDSAREVVVLRYIDQLGSPEIARRLQVSPGAVRMRLKRAMDELRRKLDDEQPEEGRGWRAAWLSAFEGLDVSGSGIGSGAVSGSTPGVSWMIAASLLVVALGGWWFVGGGFSGLALEEQESEEVALSPASIAPAQAPLQRLEDLGYLDDSAEGSSRQEKSAAVTAPSGFHVPGRVVDEWRRPAGGVEVRLVMRGREELVTQADEFGRFRFEDVPLETFPADGGVFAIDDQGRCGSLHERLPRSNAFYGRFWRFDNDLVLREGAPVTVDVQVDGQPAPNAEVRVFAGYERHLCAVRTVGEDGRVDLGMLPAGVLRIEAVSANQCGRQTLRTFWNTPAHVELELLPTRSLTLVVKDVETGAPIEGVAVEVSEEVMPSSSFGVGIEAYAPDARRLGLGLAPTDHRGRTHIHGLPVDSKLQLVLSKPGYRDARGKQSYGSLLVPVEQSQQGNLHVELQRMEHRQVRWSVGNGGVQLEDGARVPVETVKSRDGVALVGNPTATAIVADGVLTLDGVVEGDWQGLARDERGRVASLVVKAGESEGRSTRWRLPRKIQVLVLDEAGQPAIGAGVVLHHPRSHAVDRAQCDDHGRATLECDLPGKLTLEVHPPGAPHLLKTLDAIPGSSWNASVEAVLPDSSTYRFRCTLGGRPAPTADLIFRMGGGGGWQSLVLEEEILEQGTLTVRCWTPAAGEPLKGLIVRRGGTSTPFTFEASEYESSLPLEIELAPNATILAWIDISAIAGAKSGDRYFGLLQWNEENATYGELIRNDGFPPKGWRSSNTGDGAYRYGGLAAGRYQLIDRSTGETSAAIEVPAVSGETEVFWKLVGVSGR